MLDKYLIICREDSFQNNNGIWIKGKYRLAAGGARKETFDSLEKAEEYCKTISPSREPYILKVVKKGE